MTTKEAVVVQLPPSPPAQVLRLEALTVAELLSVPSLAGVPLIVTATEAPAARSPRVHEPALHGPAEEVTAQVTPAGRVSVRETPKAVGVPVLAMVMVNVTSVPTTTGDAGLATVVMERVVGFCGERGSRRRRRVVWRSQPRGGHDALQQLACSSRRAGLRHMRSACPTLPSPDYQLGLTGAQAPLTTS